MRMLCQPGKQHRPVKKGDSVRFIRQRPAGQPLRQFQDELLRTAPQSGYLKVSVFFRGKYLFALRRIFVLRGIFVPREILSLRRILALILALKGNNRPIL